MSGKPKVFKMGGSWLWLCDHGGSVGDTFPESQWRSPWDACLGAAVKHAAAFHPSAQGEEITK
jgi:hypothetical protein